MEIFTKSVFKCATAYKIEVDLCQIPTVFLVRDKVKKKEIEAVIK